MTINYISFVFFLCLGCLSSCKHSSKVGGDVSIPILCTDSWCKGTYAGPEFINGADIAHQFSNKMAAAVGEQLKELYRKEHYSKVDFSKVNMTTVGMGSGIVKYVLVIPFMSVDTKCSAYTSFDHVGGWNHVPALPQRKKQLESLLLEGDELDISDLKVTSEGLQEYWIQWRHKDVQKSCTNANR